VDGREEPGWALDLVRTFHALVKKFLAGKSKSTFLALLVCQPAG
jgi:hypothetical protein